MAKRVFIQNPFSGEPAAYCGAVGDPDLMTAIMHFVKAEVDQSIGSDEKQTDIVFTFKEMSDEEVAALPDM